MRRPIPRIIPQIKGKNDPIEQPRDAAQLIPDYADKLKLATSLHEQGIDPVRWQEAEPAPHAAQRLYRETRQAPEDMFVVQDRLYRRSPAIAATPDQGKDDLDVYLGAAPRPIAELVPVDRVQLRHPLGNRPAKLPAGSEALERYRRFAKLGIDPDSAHEGDAIPHHLQDGLKRAVIGADGKEMPLGIPGVYRNPDDGFFYLAHSGTEEGKAVKDLRTRLATEKMERTGSAEPVAANDNDSDIDEAVAQFYAQTSEGNEQRIPENRGQSERQEASDAAQEFRKRLELITSAIKKGPSGDALTPDEKQALVEFDEFASRHDRTISQHQIDIEELEGIGKELKNPGMNPALMAGLAAAYAGSPAMASLPTSPGGTMQKALPYLAKTAASARWLSGIGTFAMLMRPKETAGPQPGEQAPIKSSEEMLDLLAAHVAENLKPVQPEKTESAKAEAPNGANDNLPDPANDNDPSRGPNLTATTAATVTAWLLDEHGEETDEAEAFAPSEKFTPDSKDMRDVQEDFAHAILQGQLPVVWLDGKLITAANPYGSRGAPHVQRLDEETAVAVKTALDQCRGISNVKHLGGGDNLKQFHIGDLDAQGIKNSVRLDVTLGFQHGNYKCLYHINSIDMTKSGNPTLREEMAADRMRRNTAKIIERLGVAKTRGLPHAEIIGESGTVFDSIRKPMTDAEVNEIIRDFMDNVFSCARITRECVRASPQGE